MILIKFIFEIENFPCISRDMRSKCILFIGFSLPRTLNPYCRRIISHSQHTRPYYVCLCSLENGFRHTRCIKYLFRGIVNLIHINMGSQKRKQLQKCESTGRMSAFRLDLVNWNNGHILKKRLNFQIKATPISDDTYSVQCTDGHQSACKTAFFLRNVLKSKYYHGELLINVKNICRQLKAKYAFEL